MTKRSEQTDEQLAAAVRSGDTEQYAGIVGRYQEKLLRYAGYLVRDNALAADIVQEAFIKAYKNLNGYNPSLKFSSWIYRIVHNEAVNAVKKEGKTVRMKPDMDWASDENIESEFSRKELADMVTGCLSGMPVMYAEPLALYYLDEKSYAEISDILRLPMGTVATRINRAKSMMKRLCQKKL